MHAQQCCVRNDTPLLVLLLALHAVCLSCCCCIICQACKHPSKSSNSLQPTGA
jgi:hypothetical protein